MSAKRKTNSNWLIGIPEDPSVRPQYVDDGITLPKLFLCKCLTMDATYGYRYTYRIGFVTAKGKWNIDDMGGLIKVVAYQYIDADESEEQMLKDIAEVEDYFVEKVTDELKKKESKK